MKSPLLFQNIYLYTRGDVDFRKSIDGLTSIVQSELSLDVFGPSLFVFLGRRKDRIKVVYWDRTGFALWMKRLEKDRFPWPTEPNSASVSVSPQELDWLLEGINIFAVRPHGTLNFSQTY